MANPTIKDSILIHHNVGEALRLLKKRMTDLSLTEYMSEVEEIDNDYRIMCGCLAHNMRDPQGEIVYNHLLRRTFRLYSNVRLASIVKKRLPFIRCANVAKRFDASDESVGKSLENYVQETAMASLTLGDMPNTSVARINAIHQRYMDELFSALLVSNQWSEDNKRFYSELLVSPTVDQDDVSLILSTLTMALLNVVDVNKWLVLVHVYANSTVESVKQRALIGAMLTLPHGETSLYPEITETVKSLCQSTAACREIGELQLQLFLCMQTEEDNAEIQRDIMPTLIKNNKFKMTRDGIVESDEDSLNDILDSDSVDKNMAEMEEKMKKMMAMKDSGSDIYFGGFSHMKRLSFFYQLSNWFAPFSFDNPDVASVLKGENGDIIRKAIVQGPFCDSDKYSFVFALASVIDKLPASVKEVVASGKGIADSAVDVNTESAAYIRRMYLQDLYRFFKLHSERKDFANPFERKNDEIAAFFIGNELFDGLLHEELLVVERHLFKSKKYEDVEKLFSRLVAKGIATDDEKLLCALTYLRLGRIEDAYGLFNELQANGYDALRVQKGLADTLFALRRYADAAECYKKLLAADPSNRRYILCHSLALVNSGNVKDGLADLFRLDYENGNDVDVKRIIAWGYLVDCKPDDAERVYDWIVKSDKVADTDWLNCGYAKFVLSKTAEATQCFKRFADLNNAADACEVLEKEFANDWDTLAKNGVKDFEVKLILDVVADR